MRSARNVGGYITTKVALTPRDQADAAALSLEGPGLARANGAHSALFVVQTGPSTGAPDSMSVVYRLEESAVQADGATWTAVAVSAANPVVGGTIAAASSRSFLEIDLTGLKEFVRLTFTVAHVGGTSPKTGLTAECIFGGLADQPPSHA